MAKKRTTAEIAKEVPVDPTWWFGFASQYRDNPRGGTFSPRVPVSSHRFGWNPIEKWFVLEDNHGAIVGKVQQRLPVPIDLAEMFMLRCVDPEFNQRFLVSAFPNETAIECIELDSGFLRLSRPNAEPIQGISRHRMPGLGISLGQEADSASRLWLFHELRTDFGLRTKGLSPDDIRSRLHA